MKCKTTPPRKPSRQKDEDAAFVRGFATAMVDSLSYNHDYYTTASVMHDSHISVEDVQKAGALDSVVARLREAVAKGAQ